jgi:lipid-A-disaccharide synthase
MSLRVVVSAGEVSGDKHLARVIPFLRTMDPAVEIRGMAGAECAAAGVELLVDCYRTGSTMGFGDVVRSAGKIFSSFSTMSRLIREWRPDIVVLVDYPDFNLRLAKVARNAGAKVLYYIPPKVWAWRAGRVEKIKRYVDRVAAIFPFEPAFFEKRGFVNVSYVGHPLGDRVGVVTDDREKTLLLLPGSRRSEVERILPPMLRVFERLAQSRPELLAKVVVAPNMSREWLTSLSRGVVSEQVLNRISWMQGEALEEMKRAQAGILKCGTCNLEGAVAGLPFVSVYSGSKMSKVITSALVPLKEFSPVNILRSGTVSEVFGVTIDEGSLEREVGALLDSGSQRDSMLRALREVRESLVLPAGESGGSVPERVARLIISTVGGEVKERSGEG